MNTLIKRMIASLLLISTISISQVLASQSTVSHPPPDINNPAVVEAFVDGIVKPAMKMNHSPSGVVTLMKGGDIIFAKGYGYQDVEKQIPVDAATTLFRPGSISKLFTWVAVMQQVERGNLDLDTDVNQYLNTFEIEDTWPGQPVTLRHILSHTAGFEDGVLGYLIIDDASRIVPLAQSLASYMPTRVNPPGKHTAYSNWATALAGLIVANVSGLEFNAYIQQNIFDVLEMKNSSFVEPLPTELDNNMAKAYDWKAGQYVEKNYEIISNFGPAGSLAATSYDMTKFAQAILGGGEFENSKGNRVRILQEATMKLMLTTLHTHDSRTRGMAYGFLEYPYNGVDIVGHDGGTTVFLSHFGLSLEHNMMLFHSFSGPGNVSVYSAIKDAFYDYFFPSELKDISPDDDFAERAANFVGSYRPWRASFTKIEALYGAFQAVKISALPNNTLLVKDTRFVEEQRNLFRQVDGDRRIVFQENDSGEITGYINDGLAANQMFKVPLYDTFPFFLLTLVVSIIVFVAVILRRLYQKALINALSAKEKATFNASLMVSIANLTFLLLACIAVVTARNLVYELPWLLEFSFVFPILALLATIYQLYHLFFVWRDSLGSVWSRVRFSVVSLCGVLMVWQYNNWNLLGFNYFN